MVTFPESTLTRPSTLEHNPLDTFFAPKSVAVIGATETPGSVGRTILWNLISSPFGGTVFPVNPRRSQVLGIKAYSSIAAVPDAVDLAVVVTPASAVPGVIGACADAGVKSAIVISAGFREVGPEGAELEQCVLAEARRGGIRIVGPNCLGLMNPRNGLNATFASSMALPGNVAFISQSGALCTAVLDWSLRERIGFSAFVSVGAMLDVGWGDLIDYLADDPNTTSILLYMESIGNAGAFLSAAREMARSKPIIVIKAGRSAQAAHAAASHTGALAGSDDVLDAAFRRCGVLRVNTISELFAMAEVLAKQPRPRGPRLTILTNAGGPGVLATDALIASGGELTSLAPGTIEALNQTLPSHWSHGNPIDILGDADAARYAKAVSIAASDSRSDGLLVMLTPQAMTDPTRTAQELAETAKTVGKPLLASWMGGPAVAVGDEILSHANIPTFEYPDMAAQAFGYMWQYSRNLRSLYETPTLPTGTASVDSEGASRLLEHAREAGRTILTESESKQLLAAYGIPTVPTQIATTAAKAAGIAAQIGYPVVVKLHSETITHKTDVGGVKLNLADETAVRRAFEEIQTSVAQCVGGEHFGGVTVQPMISADGYEVIVGSSIDPQFGPVLLFGSGGQLVEVTRDRVLGLPPLTTTLARRMVEQTRISHAFGGVRGRQPVDMTALDSLLVRFSQLVVEQRWIKEIDINPLLVSTERLLALDARVVLHDPALEDAELPQPAIRPYPTQYISHWTMHNGTDVVLRPIRAEDEPLLVDFHGTLSDQSVYFRYFRPMHLDQRVTHERLTRICFIDYNREMALVAERRNLDTGQSQIIGVGRLTQLPGTNDVEYALLVSDPHQRQGLGTQLLECLIEIGRAEQRSTMVGYVLRENTGMLRVCQRLGFHTLPGAGPIQVVLPLEKTM